MPAVFNDPSGRRTRRVSRGTLVAWVLLTVVITAFALTLYKRPELQSLNLGTTHKHSRPVRAIPTPNEVRLDQLAQQSHVRLFEHIKGQKVAHPPKPDKENIVGAFYAPWQETGLHSLRANAKHLTHIFPAWVKLSIDGKSFDYSDFDPNITPKTEDVLKIATTNGLSIVPLVTNANGDVFDSHRTEQLLANPAQQAKMVGELAGWVKKWKFAGINLDLENLDAKLKSKVPNLIRNLKLALGPASEVSVDMEASAEPSEFKSYAVEADYLVLMAYDENYEGGPSGPIASFDWTGEILEKTLESVPANKLVLGIGSYAYDWKVGGGAAESITFQEAIRNAIGYRDSENPADVIEFDPKALNPHFDYTDDEDKLHHVWMLDATTAYNQLLAAAPKGIRGASVWSLGTEDPSLWSVFSREAKGHLQPPSNLKTVSFPYDVEFAGTGEILSVEALPQPGKRDLDIEKETNLIVDSNYTQYPSSYLMRRSGYREKAICLTFDDGPDPKYTREILDELSHEGVQGTFFVIGENAEKNPDLVREIVSEGHEIGNHSFTHPNLGATSATRVRLELNATQRAIQSITGKSTILFRPPYNADAEPASAEEVQPILEASRLGYLDVGEFIDPQDWNLESQDVTGTVRLRTAEDIAEAAYASIKHGGGNVVLFHDGGGDRSRTAAALRILIPKLRGEHYKFMGVAELLGVSRDKIMPSVSWADLALVRFDGTVFWIGYTLTWLLAAGFLAAIGLGLLRIIVMVPLALIHARVPSPVTGANRLSVSVMIAAFNEEKVIGRTIQSVLASTCPIHEIIVVDDGSTDGTAGVVQDLAVQNPLVKFFRKENGGKASALNRAIEEATGDLLIGVDADTQLDPEAIALLAAHFEDPKIGAVAGNVRVGNPVNLLTVWQSVEYTTSQNMDRRAMATLNAITVVPGAIGAWRSSAVREVGGFVTDTLAEDMDLTWRIRERGWRMETESRAYAYTEAPETLNTFFKQRFRWAYGTLQCLWKHRRALGKHGWFGWVALPSLWLFQIVFMSLAPLVDLQLLVSLSKFGYEELRRGMHQGDWQPMPDASRQLVFILTLFLIFLTAEVFSGWIAYRMDRQRGWFLVWMPLQRLVYRQIMYGVVIKSLWQALRGLPQGWNKLDRRGSVLR